MDEEEESVFEDEPKRPDWSVQVDDSIFYSDSKTPIGKSDVGSLVNLSGKYLRSDRLILTFAILGVGSLLSASVLAYNKWGSQAAAAAASMSVNSPSVPPSVDLSGEPSLALNNPTPTTVALPWEAVTTPQVTPHPTYHPTKSPTLHPTESPTKTTMPPPTKAPTKVPSNVPSSRPSQVPLVQEPTYIPGNLTTLKADLLLSDGLDARIIAITDQKVPYDLGGWSEELFHSRPDGGATFPDPSDSNPGGWIYVSNSEVELNQGGVGALTFDKNGNVIDYRMLLRNSSMNCGGGRTPWSTWVSCEEVEFTGQIYQVDPTGKRNPEVMTLGRDGGRWESFTFDIRDLNTPHFFATEDHSKGALRRFTPDSPNWDDPWSILHGSGTTDFLMIFPNETMEGGTYIWTNDKEAAKSNAKQYYPMTEGIDVYQGTMIFVCKQIHMMFVLDLDSNTYYNHTTTNGLFDGKPDQMQRVLNDSRDLLYFTEEGGVDAGVHARDHLGRFYTVFESPVHPDETTGLSFSPDGRFMYTAYQTSGLLYTIWRKDGLPFHASHLDVKYHYQPA